MTPDELAQLIIQWIDSNQERKEAFLNVFKGQQSQDGTFEMDANKDMDNQVMQTIADQIKREGHIPTPERVEQRVARIQQEITYRNLVKNWTGR